MTRVFRIMPLMALVVLLMAALTTSGFAHRLMTPAQAQAEISIAALGLASGDICGDKQTTSGKGCEACRLQAAMALPEPAITTILVELDLNPADWAPQPAALHDLTHPTGRQARAPPTV